VPVQVKRVLTIRIALMSLGVDAFNILSLTFTNKAAREMKNVFLTLWAPAKLKPLDELFLGFAKILRSEPLF
jgi:DNA helicase-2/ATP-dependent DNA helicase PcrA